MLHIIFHKSLPILFKILLLITQADINTWVDKECIMRFDTCYFYLSDYETFELTKFEHTGEEYLSYKIQKVFEKYDNLDDLLSTSEGQDKLFRLCTARYYQNYIDSVFSIDVTTKRTLDSLVFDVTDSLTLIILPMRDTTTIEYSENKNSWYYIKGQIQKMIGWRWTDVLISTYHELAHYTDMVLRIRNPYDKEKYASESGKLMLIKAYLIFSYFINNLNNIK